MNLLLMLNNDLWKSRDSERKIFLVLKGEPNQYRIPAMNVPRRII